MTTQQPATISPWAIAIVVTEKAVSAMLEGSGEGNYRDSHPWLIAKEMHEAGLPMPLLLAAISESQEISFSHWGIIRQIDVVELHRGQWDTRCSFTPLQPMNPIWSAVDSVFLKPSDEQLERERREGIKVSRIALDEHHIHPYAICETPVFISDTAS